MRYKRRILLDTPMVAKLFKTVHTFLHPLLNEDVESSEQQKQAWKIYTRNDVAIYARKVNKKGGKANGAWTYNERHDNLTPKQLQT
jgi:lipopolysaccharide export LptBFGC system permease protein LptF